MTFKQDVLIVGPTRGREHALGWKLSRDSGVGKVFHAQGNGGTINNVAVDPSDYRKLARFASENALFAVIGPDIPVAEGAADLFREQNVRVFGPTKLAARLESSKAWAKRFMDRHGVPTPRYRIFRDPKEAREYVSTLYHNVVVKADGLCAGKGVVVCSGKEEAMKAVERMMVKKEFGTAGNAIVIEKRLYGIETSYIVISDGTNYKPLATSQDHKRAYDGDRGPNTGGMGAYSPAKVDAKLEEKMQGIIGKIIDGMRKEGTPFVGFLYVGFMVANGEPSVLEINARSGDPETEPLMMRMESELFPYLDSAAGGGLASMEPVKWRQESAATVVMASRSYPGTFQVGERIDGIGTDDENSVVFHAGTRAEGDKILTDGGRVLAVTALGDNLGHAVENAYRRARAISWPSMFLRTDIGRGGL